MIPQVPKWLQRLRPVISSPVYATVTTVLAVIAGLLGSVYQADIANAFPLVVVGPWGAVSWRAATFWSSVVVFALMFFLRQWWDDATRERFAGAAIKAEEGTVRIEDLVRTLPPRAFQTQLAEMFVAVRRAIKKLGASIKD